MLTLELHRSANVAQQYHTRIKATNGRILFWTENYANKQDAINAGTILTNNGLRARWVDYTQAA